MKVLHIHQDYPDGRPYPFTQAVANLISSSEAHNGDIHHKVVSINRTSNPFKISAKRFEQGISIVYWGIPLPFIFYWSMKLSAAYIAKFIKHENIDVIHGHKLTCEGVFAYFLGKKLNKPYLLSVRGGSDMHNVKRLSVHHRFFAKVFNTAKQVLWVSAWAKAPIKKALLVDVDEGDLGDLLPNICHIDMNYPHKPSTVRRGYITAVSYHQYKRKGLAELIQAIALLHKKYPGIHLNIYGSGEKRYQDEIKALIIEHQAVAFVHLLGQVSQPRLLKAMSMSKGFLLPAVNETFGMAYIEALSVGCPILYVANTGIDGYFNDVYVGEKITQLNPQVLAASIENIEKNNEELCQVIKMNQASDLLSFCSTSHVTRHYVGHLQQVHKS